MLQGRQFLLLRNSKNITREELGALLGISPNEIIMYENGIKKIPVDLYNHWIEVIKCT